MSSFQARVLDSALRVLQVRNVGNRIFPWVYRYIATNAKPTRRLKRHHHCTMRLVKGQPVYDIRPKESAGLALRPLPPRRSLFQRILQAAVGFR